MKLITRQTLANEAADRWAEQYKHPSFRGTRKDEILGKLRALGDSPNPDDVDSVIGNNSWTHTKCTECGEEQDDVVQIGEPPDYESATADVCRRCLMEAFSMAFLD